jgi:hypothetical protein
MVMGITRTWEIREKTSSFREENVKGTEWMQMKHFSNAEG